MVDARRHHRQAAARRRTPATLLHKIAEGTWICGDPGLQYDGAIQKWHTCKGTEPIHSTNPCSEYVFLNNTACNLASLNLMKFKREDGTFDVERFKAAVRIFITAQEILVDNASYPTKEIAENSHIFRTLGLGYANLGSLIMSYGLPYDSRRRPRPGRRDHRDHDRPRLRAERANIAAAHGRRSRAIATPAARTCRSRWRRTTSNPCSASSSSIASAVEEIQPQRGIQLSEGGSAPKSGTRALERGQRQSAIATRRSPCSRPPAPSPS